MIPAGLALQADSLPAECKADGQKVTCVAAKPLEKGQSFTYSYKVTVNIEDGSSLVSNAHVLVMATVNVRMRTLPLLAVIVTLL